MPHTITCEDALDRYEDYLNDYIQNAYWEKNACENAMMELLDECAADDDFVIDWQTGDGKRVWDVYRFTEKGLS